MGVVGYFKLVKSLIVVFCIMSALVLPNLIMFSQVAQNLFLCFLQPSSVYRIFSPFFRMPIIVEFRRPKRVVLFWFG